MYFVNTTDKLNEALLLKMESERLHRDDQFEVIALMEEPEMRLITVKSSRERRDRSFFDSYDLPIVPADPDIDGIVRALAKAIELARRGYTPRGDANRSFACSWDEAFSPRFIAKTISDCAIPIETQAEGRTF